MIRDLLSTLAAGLGVAALMSLAAPAQEAPEPAQEALKLEGLVLHYSFDQDGPVADQSGRNNPGTIQAAKWTATGKQGGGLDLAQPAAHVKIAGSESLTLQQTTLAVWFKASQTKAQWELLLDQGLPKGFALCLTGSTEGTDDPRGRVAATIDGAVFCTGVMPAIDNAWHHAAATFDGKSLAVYLDGNLQNTVELSEVKIAPNPEHIAVGKIRPDEGSPVAMRSFVGTLDEVMIFNRALSPDEIKTLVTAIDPEAGKPRFTPQQVTGRLRQLRLLREEGLLTAEFYNRKVAECGEPVTP